MPEPPPFDAAAAHRIFSADCFNRTWELIDKPDRTPAESDEMIDTAHASAWHWRSRPDATPRNRSIACWQLSRVYTQAGEAGRAKHYGQLSLEASRAEPPFFQGYAHEALARAALLAGDRSAADRHLAEARALLAQVADPEERELLGKDLDALGK